MDENILAEIVYLISHAKKLRLPSFIRSSYGRSEKSELTKEEFLAGIENKDVKCLEWIYHNDLEALNLLKTQDFRDHQDKAQILSFITTEWKRLKPTPSKIGNKERFIFVVVPWLWIMYKDDINETEVHNVTISSDEIDQAYKKTDVVFGEFVYDVHTREGRKNGKTEQDFRQDTDTIQNEDKEWLSKFIDLKKHYLNQTDDVKLNKPIKTNNNFDEIDLDVNNILLITEGVCGNKLPCGIAKIDGIDKIIKPVTKNFNYGLDYLFIDKQKEQFGFKPLDIKLQKIPGKSLVIDHTDDQKEYKWIDNEEGQIIAVMNKIDVKTNLSKMKPLICREDKFKEMLKIRLFNGIFRTSDNIIRNILVDTEEQMWGIDTNDIFGKRKLIFNKKENCVKFNEFLTRKVIHEIITEFDLPNNKIAVISDLKYFFPNKPQYVTEFTERIENYEQIVLDELELEL